MAVAFDRVAEIIAENADIPREKITPESHVIDDLGIDSLDFLDVVFALDQPLLDALVPLLYPRDPGPPPAESPKPEPPVAK